MAHDCIMKLFIFFLSILHAQPLMVIQLHKQNVTSFFSICFNQNAVTQKIGAYQQLKEIQLKEQPDR